MQAARQLSRFWKRASVFLFEKTPLFEQNVTENIGRQPPTDCVNTLPGRLQLNTSNAEHFRPRDFQKRGQRKRRLEMNHWEYKTSEH